MTASNKTIAHFIVDFINKKSMKEALDAAIDDIFREWQ